MIDISVFFILEKKINNYKVVDVVVVLKENQIFVNENFDEIICRSILK